MCTVCPSCQRAQEQVGDAVCFEPTLKSAAFPQVLQADLVLWTAGSSPVSKEGVSDKTPKLPFPATDKGAIRTDPMLRVRDHPRVFALGDVSGSELPGPPASGNSLPATAQVPCSAIHAALCADPGCLTGSSFCVWLGSTQAWGSTFSGYCKLRQAPSTSMESLHCVHGHVRAPGAVLLFLIMS